MTSLELLAPAKNLECGMAAITHGADAVYIGAPRFGARAAAGNSIEDIAELCRYAHVFGAKVFVTVNTIIYDSEIEDTVTMIEQLDRVGVDALLVQDMGLLSTLRQRIAVGKTSIRCAIHASTQTDNRTVEKVKWLASLGLKRVVLARELSIEEIRAIHDSVPEVELEVFVHGALCVSYSGQCYASQYCFQRSANRGECAQFCRLAFTLKDANDRILERDRHLLSLKDMAQIDNLERLAEAGAVSFKIEGRLKDVDYVKNVTAEYSQKLNDIVAKYPQRYRRASFGHCEYSFTPNIKKSFNRGFTTYFADGRQTGLVSFDTPKAMGEPVGKVKEIRGKSFNVAGTASFSNGDGLCFLDENRRLIGFRVNKVEGNRIFPLRLPYELKPGVQLFRNFDQSFNNALAKQTAERKIGISFQLTTTANEITLTATDECGRVTSAKASCELQKAERSQEENIRRQLSKLGGTPFECIGITILSDAFIPSSILTSLRREIVERISGMEINSETAANGAVSKDSTDAIQQSADAAAALNQYDQPYLLNALNEASKQFYTEQGVDDADAFEATDKYHSERPLLMQCRYCLRNEMGYCTKSGKRAPWKEPLCISLPDGKEFELQFDCKHCQMNVITKPSSQSSLLRKAARSLILFLCIFLSSCYSDSSISPEKSSRDTIANTITDEQRDSISFFSKRHYTEGYNFIIYSDSITLLLQQPEEMVSQLETDTFPVYENHQLVVGDIRILPQDSIDSVWVQVATDQGEFGWIHEKDLLKNVVPVDPISQFIMFFSDSHIIISLVIIVLLCIAYVMRHTYRHNAPIVHLRDIPTFYPTLLCLIVATAATGYASLQMFAPETWQHYFYHPTLNPLQMPFILGIFISSIWAMLIAAIAAIDDTRKYLAFPDNILYLASLIGTCAILYIVFSISTLYYIGYPLLVLYYAFALRHYFKSRNRYICGNCGEMMRDKGKCPHCGVINE